MPVLDKKTLHAIEAILTIARYTGVNPISGKDIAAEHDLPPRYLEQVLQKLVRGGLLRGVRGPRGGYVLAREKRRITLADVLKAAQSEQDDTLESPYAPLNVLMHEIEKEVHEKLQTLTLQDLIPATPKSKKTADFAI